MTELFALRKVAEAARALMRAENHQASGEAHDKLHAALRELDEAGEGVMRKLSQEEIDGLSPGIRGAVLWMRAQGYETVDSGDGSNHAAGMEGATEYPMIAIRTTKTRLLMQAHNLMVRLRNAGVKIAPDSVQVEASYNPADNCAIIVVTELGAEGYLARLAPPPDEGRGE